MKEIKYNEKEIHKPFPISQSKINLFNSCKLQFYFRYLTDLGDMSITWPGTLFGKTEHAILEDIIAKIKEGERKELALIRSIKGSFQSKFDEFVKEAGKKFKESRAYNYNEFVAEGEKYAKVLASFINRFIPQEFHRLESEKNLTIHYDKEIDLTGIIDVMLFQDEKNFDIFDLKNTTDSEKFYFVDWDFEMQSTMYDLISSKHYKGKMNSFAFIVMNRDDRTLFIKQNYSILRDDEVEERRFKNLKQDIDNVKTFVFGKREELKRYKCNKYDSCKWCGYSAVCKKI